MPNAHSSAYRCGGSAGWRFRPQRLGVTLTHDRAFFLLPVELRHVNHTASTNEPDSTPPVSADSTIDFAMANQHTQIEQITERVERLLVRYEELQRTNLLLEEQVMVLTHERDTFQARLNAARARVDALIDRLPNGSPAASQVTYRPQ